MGTFAAVSVSPHTLQTARSNGQTINAQLCSEQLERIHVILAERCPALINHKIVLLQQDSARPHTFQTTHSIWTSCYQCSVVF